MGNESLMERYGADAGMSDAFLKVYDVLGEMVKQIGSKAVVRVFDSIGLWYSVLSVRFPVVEPDIYADQLPEPRRSRLRILY